MTQREAINSSSVYHVSMGLPTAQNRLCSKMSVIEPPNYEVGESDSSMIPLLGGSLSRRAVGLEMPIGISTHHSHAILGWDGRASSRGYPQMIGIRKSWLLRASSFWCYAGATRGSGDDRPRGTTECDGRGTRDSVW